MHLLAAQPGSLTDGSEAVDLGQTPAPLVILSAADTELAVLAAAHDGLGGRGPEMRLANLLGLAHPMSVDLYVDTIIAKARMVVVRLLGGRSYWPYGVEQIAACCRRNGIILALLPGDDKPDPDLMADSTLAPEAVDRLWRYLIHGGPSNAVQFLGYARSLMGEDGDWLEPMPVPPAGLLGEADAADTGQPRAVLIFYRALVLSGDTAPVTALAEGLRAAGLAVSTVFVHSLKDPMSAGVLESLLDQAPPDVVVNLTGFAVSSPGRPEAGPFARYGCPVFQAVAASGSEGEWRRQTRGLGPRDIAMNVALPEVDGRILAGAVSFKAATRHIPTQCDIARHQPVADRVAFIARLAASWATLRRKPEGNRKVALILANYPNRDGRLGNGVGLDTPAATVAVLHALRRAGYRLDGLPADGNALIETLQQGVTNDITALDGRVVRESLSLPEYQAFFQALPKTVQQAVTDRWGPPEADPFFQEGRLSCGQFRLPALCFGNVMVAVQPARGYNIDPASSYHDPALPPPHNYLALYAWVREGFRADAVVHMGKHGNLEWLPGKALALSEDCYPGAVLGPLPHLYPFIVNDPGEGTQAKRRAAAVIIDHLTPPLTRAETYGPLRALEHLVDEYYEAAGVDPRRLAHLTREILTLVGAAGLDQELGIGRDDAPAEALSKLDAHLCALKELQIRDGLHVFGTSPTGTQLHGLLVALARVGRGAEAKDQSLTRALARDLGLTDFDPLDCDMAAAWTGPRPDALAGLTEDPWRSQGDTVERLELLAHALVAGETPPDPAWADCAAVLDWIDTDMRPRVEACGQAEMTALLAGLAGRFVAPGPSGAPTRGRPDVLPTGRNFYSVDTRSVPTPAAWALGWKSATLLLERHFQDQGDWPRAVALSAWGTANMRTGGDDIAQGLALMGVRPRWETGSGRVVGYEILPASVLDRPRVDVTLRISGFFRDAFPDLVALFDRAARAVAALDEPEAVNPLAARVRAESARLATEEGLAVDEARRRAGFRVFGSKPGAYGAGLQALIDEGGWRGRTDLAEAYVAWGGWAYDGAEGEAGHALFRRRLSGVEAVLHNQDNREHDLLDSDDYYQFEGGLAAAVETARGQAPAVYHSDHSRPESPAIRTLEEEIARVVRGRVVNPKWIRGVMRHGYKGAFEMAASLDYLFAFAATTNAVKDHQFDLVAQAYLEDEEVRSFLEDNNPAALKEMRQRLREAHARGLWHPRRNALFALLEAE